MKKVSSVGIGRASKQEGPVSTVRQQVDWLRGAIAQMEKELWTGPSPRSGWPGSIDEVGSSVMGPVTFKA